MNIVSRYLAPKPKILARASEKSGSFGDVVFLILNVSFRWKYMAVFTVSPSAFNVSSIASSKISSKLRFFVYSMQLSMYTSQAHVLNRNKQ